MNPRTGSATPSRSGCGCRWVPYAGFSERTDEPNCCRRVRLRAAPGRRCVEGACAVARAGADRALHRSELSDVRRDRGEVLVELVVAAVQPPEHGPGQFPCVQAGVRERHHLVVRAVVEDQGHAGRQPPLQVRRQREVDLPAARPRTGRRRGRLRRPGATARAPARRRRGPPAAAWRRSSGRRGPRRRSARRPPRRSAASSQWPSRPPPRAWAGRRPGSRGRARRRGSPPAPRPLGGPPRPRPARTAPTSASRPAVWSHVGTSVSVAGGYGRPPAPPVGRQLRDEKPTTSSGKDPVCGRVCGPPARRELERRARHRTATSSAMTGGTVARLEAVPGVRPRYPSPRSASVGCTASARRAGTRHASPQVATSTAA